MSPATRRPKHEPIDLPALMPYLQPEELLVLKRAAAAGGTNATRAAVGLYPAPEAWEDWLRTLFPQHFYHPFGKRHEEFWSWVWAIEPDTTPRPFIAVWPRESGKSTNAEAAAVALGTRGKRKYAIYIRITQDKADDSVTNIAAMLESEAVATHYPAHADRMVGKFGQAKGWRRNRVRTAGGFTVDALGLDVPVRGIKMEQQRPDLIIIDDCDAADDSPAIIAKKVNLITRAVLPAGAQNVAVLGAQNLISAGGIFTQLANGTADYLADRIVSGPYPAIDGLKYEWRTDAVSKVRYAHIVAGRATWEGQPLDVCQRNIRRWSLSAFLKEAQHKVTERAEGAVLRFREADGVDDDGNHVPSSYEDLTDDDCRALVDKAIHTRGRPALFGGMDFGAWRFAFALYVVTPQGVCIRIDEYFAQRLPGEASLTERAQAIHETCEFYGIPVDAEEYEQQRHVQSAEKEQLRTLPIWGDQANPTDITEINAAFKKGWIAEVEERGQLKKKHVRSRLRVVAVASENKLRKTAVDRINDMLDRNVLRFRRGLDYEWLLGANAGNEGVPQRGSRLIWETANWCYAIPRPGEEQNQDPDDATADGADMMAAQRYALMSVFGATKLEQPPGVWPDDKKPPFDVKKRKFVPPVHLADLLKQQKGRKPPPMPRPRGR